MTAPLDQRTLILGFMGAAALLLGLLIVDTFFSFNHPHERREMPAVGYQEPSAKKDPAEPSPFWD